MYGNHGHLKKENRAFLVPRLIFSGPWKKSGGGFAQDKGGDEENNEEIKVVYKKKSIKNLIIICWISETGQRENSKTYV